MEKLKQFMMGSEKLKWFLKISLVLLFFVSCKNDNKTKGNKKTLECALSVFVDNTNDLGKFIYVSEMVNWSDSTAMIAIQSSNKYPSKPVDGYKTMIGMYNSHEIIYFTNAEEIVITNDLLWNEPTYKEENSPTLDDIDASSEAEIQFTFDKTSKEIKNGVKSYPVSQKDVLESLKRCN